MFSGREQVRLVQQEIKSLRGQFLGIRGNWEAVGDRPPPSPLKPWERRKQQRPRAGVACLSLLCPTVAGKSLGGPSAHLRGEEFAFTLGAPREGTPGFLLPQSAFQFLQSKTVFCKPAFVSRPPPYPAPQF